jgi:hypothetical protein
MTDDKILLRPVANTATVLIDQPDKRPTRKVAASTVAQAVTSLFVMVTALGFDVPQVIRDATIEVVVAVVAIAQAAPLIAGYVSAWFTRERG